MSSTPIHLQLPASILSHQKQNLFPRTSLKLRKIRTRRAPMSTDRSRPRWRCSAAENKTIQKLQKQTNRRRIDDLVDPVGFLARLGIVDKSFAQFLRDRYSSPSLKPLNDYLSFSLFHFSLSHNLLFRHKILKDRKSAIALRFLGTQEAAAGFVFFS